jgi:hypothetical protein
MVRETTLTVFPDQKKCAEHLYSISSVLLSLELKILYQTPVFPKFYGLKYDIGVYDTPSTPKVMQHPFFWIALIKTNPTSYCSEFCSA